MKLGARVAGSHEHLVRGMFRRGGGVGTGADMMLSSDASRELMFVLGKSIRICSRRP
jgi:hypothetical protein